MADQNQKQSGRILALCESCGKEYRLSPDSVGRKAKCSCGHIFTVTGAAMQQSSEKIGTRPSTRETRPSEKPVEHAVEKTDKHLERGKDRALSRFNWAKANRKEGFKTGTGIVGGVLILLALIGNVPMLMNYYEIGFWASLLMTILMVVTFPTVVGPFVVTLVATLISGRGNALTPVMGLGFAFILALGIGAIIGGIPGWIIGHIKGSKKQKHLDAVMKTLPGTPSPQKSVGATRKRSRLAIWSLVGLAFLLFVISGVLFIRYKLSAPLRNIQDKYSLTNSRFLFEADRDTRMSQEQLETYVSIRQNFLPHLNELVSMREAMRAEKRIKGGGLRLGLKATKMMLPMIGKLNNTHIAALNEHKMSVKEYRWIGQRAFAALYQGAQAGNSKCQRDWDSVRNAFIQGAPRTTKYRKTPANLIATLDLSDVHPTKEEIELVQQFSTQLFQPDETLWCEISFVLLSEQSEKSAESSPWLNCLTRSSSSRVLVMTTILDKRTGANLQKIREIEQLLC